MRSSVHFDFDIEQFLLILVVILILRQIRVLSSLVSRAQLALNFVTQRRALCLRHWVHLRRPLIMKGSRSSSAALVIHQLDLQLLHLLTLRVDLLVSKPTNSRNDRRHNHNGSDIRAFGFDAIRNRRRNVHFIAIIASPAIIAQAVHIATERIAGAHSLRRAHRDIVGNIRRIGRVCYALVRTRKCRGYGDVVTVVIALRLFLVDIEVFFLHKRVKDSLRFIRQFDVSVAVVWTKQRDFKLSIARKAIFQTNAPIIAIAKCEHYASRWIVFVIQRPRYIRAASHYAFVRLLVDLINISSFGH
mmetsp:Transcript_30408/g.48716  ORF Transcript_30408/g.48716 Transcript_30408/m.48716 type:complete len:302 (-) Transcript_30408:1413-2318(-)